jgi:hypothetical protein
LRLIVTPRLIYEYRYCPLRCRFLWEKEEEPTIPLEITIIGNAIKSILWTGTTSGHPSWKMARRKLDIEIKRAIQEHGISPQGYKDLQPFLLPLYSWYFDCFEKKYSDGDFYINFPLIVNLDDYTTFYDKIDIVQVTKNGKIRVFDFTHRIYPKREIYANPAIQSRLWALSELGMEPTQYVRFIVLPKVIRTTVLKLSSKFKSRAEKATLYTLKGMRGDVFPPLLSERCSKCEYLYECNYSTV